MEVAIIIAIVLSVLSLLMPKAKTTAIIFFFFSWLMMGWNYYNGDYYAYKLMYDILDPFILNFGEYEFGYNFIMSLFKVRGYDFEQYFICISFLALLGILTLTLKLSRYPAIVATCFFWIYLPLDFVLLRNFVAFVIICLGLTSVLRNAKNGKLLFILSVIVATTVHISSVFYFIFLLLPKENIISVKKVSLYIIIALFLYLGVRNSIISFIGGDAIMRMEAYKNNYNMFIIYAFYQYMNVFIVRHFTITRNRESTVIYNINVLMLFLIVFYYDMTIFVRVFRNISFINVIYFVNYISISRNKALSTLFLLLYLAFFFYTFVYPVLDDTIYSLFKYNLFFKLT